jgi:3-oxoacyl-[acyl-carrier protein] reductase
VADGGSFSGRIALVTGGSGGIGAALCRALAAEGAEVAVGYGSNRAAAESLVAELSVESRTGGGRCGAFEGDLSDPDGPARLVADVERDLGPIDVLVANHGVARMVAYEDVDATAFDHTLAINLRAPFLLARAVLSGMRARRYGRILFMSSSAAFRGGIIGADYAASKSGLHGMTHFLASRVAPDGVTVNALAPGLIATPMLPGDPQELARIIPVGRVGRPEEVADAAVAILRNAYMTNHVISIDGGLHPT